MLPNSELNILCHETKMFEEIKQWLIAIVAKLRKVLKLLSVRMRRRFWSYICLTGNVEYTAHWWLMWNNGSHAFRVPL